MKIELEFKYHRSHRAPSFRIWFNDILLCDNKEQDLLPNRFCFEARPNIPLETNALIIEHYDKHDQDTVLDEQGKIILDRAIEIVSIKIDEFDQPWHVLYTKKFYPIWPSHMIDKPEYIVGSLYLGFNGKYVFDFPAKIEKAYYDSLWEQERDLNNKLTQTDEDNDGLFTAYGMKIKMDQIFDFDLSKLKKLIEENEKV